MKFEINYRDDRRDTAELTFDILCRMSEKFDCTVDELTGKPRLDWLVWGAHAFLTDEGKVTLPLMDWRKTIKEVTPIYDEENLNPTDPTV